ncbi:unnamed protein product [Phytomonas sp. EM1]|nr:unnamed protein product [Phytomonas sp. EM1]|eukprot:CCW65785.1 unnamed protein product [Phytomonas sp. isolate EM1]
MKIKKKELRKGLAQLPINYPDPEILPDALPGGRIDMEAEMVQVELLCKRLAHNEVAVRDAALAEVPRYLTRLTVGMEQMEESYEEEILQVRTYFTEHPKAVNPYHYDNVPRALDEFREKFQQRERKERRRMALESLHLQRKREQLERESWGRFDVDVVPSSSTEVTEREEGKARVTTSDKYGLASSANGALSTAQEHRERYQTWVLTWSDLELVLLKLSRGIFFCLWHSDKPLVQLECAQRIANLLHAPRTIRCKNLFYGAIFRVLSREWPTIDRYRMDKYLALVRKLIFEWISLIKNLEETEEAVGGQDETLYLPRKGKTVSAGVAMENLKSKAAVSKSIKRARHVAEDMNPSEGHDKSEETADITASPTAIGIPRRYIKLYYSNRQVLMQTLLEFFYIFQEQIFPKRTSTGLTMHICDVAFDELSRACISRNLFLTLSAGIPLYAMSQGNYIEKRVLDNFFPPLAGGVYTKQREKQLFERKLHLVRGSRKSAAKKANTKKNTREQESRNEEEWHKEARKAAEGDTKTILLEIAKCCQLYAVARGTVYAVRVMFSEAELVLQQAADPDAHQSLTPIAQRRRLEKEIDEMNETRKIVKSERATLLQQKRKDKKQALFTKVKLQRKATREVHNGDDCSPEKGILEEGLRKKKKMPRNTKRKKNYQLTKKDLYSDHDDDDTHEKL